MNLALYVNFNPRRNALPVIQRKRQLKLTVNPSKNDVKAWNKDELYHLLPFH